MSSEYRSVFSFYEFSKHVHKHRGTLNTALHSCCHFTPVNLHDLHGAVLITKPRLPDIPTLIGLKSVNGNLSRGVDFYLSLGTVEQKAVSQCLFLSISKATIIPICVVKHMSPVYLSYTRPSTRRPYGTN